MTPNVGEEHPKFTEEEATERTLKKKLEADPSVFNFYVYLRTHPLIQRQNLTNKKLERGSSLDQTKDTAQFEDAVTPLERKLYFSTAHFHLRAGQFFQIPKAELLLEGFFSHSIFFPGFVLVKKLEIKKTKITKDTTFKTDIIKVVLVFSISNFFTNENSQGRKLSAI